ncbi:uncharacterized protein MELLADRAFT_86028 [Melampsora larici-populina 98AG31]|uniref:Uncharacterized protein n=1 Tax=Melampsora larici-populina (strain 98AG31 / pathotype 3-4-7) TaxID=747676 RepID=F4RKI1_MELLP|nr:uncharacterized protein MELLADRAFT_86028 [Melampsora larici-populina 98AG31]EGG07176.1 hypothetical protein MELLADRAFT_86028 [Melampsora larici-populina 98AG31]
MQSHLPAELPLRFSCIFWTRNQLPPNPKYKYFQTDVVFNRGTLTGAGLLIAAKHCNTQIRHNHAYKLEGPVSAGCDTVSTIFEEAENTIVIDSAEVRLHPLLNKVSAQGVGQILEWSLRRVHNQRTAIEVIKVLHRGRDATGKRQV